MKTKARLEILNCVTSFFLSRDYGDGVVRGGLPEFYFSPNDTPKTGDLVSLKGAPFSKYYLSWYVENAPRKNNFCDNHLIESIETGNFCSWSNVGFYVMNRKIVNEHPHWRWTDKQYEFKEKWFRACKRRNDYTNVPVYPEFKNGGEVVLTLRKKFNLGEPVSKGFPNWKKLLSRDMIEFYDSVSNDNL